MKNLFTIDWLKLIENLGFKLRHSQSGLRSIEMLQNEVDLGAVHFGSEIAGVHFLVAVV